MENTVRKSVNAKCILWAKWISANFIEVGKFMTRSFCVMCLTFSLCSGGQTGFIRLPSVGAGDDGVVCGDADAFASISMKIERDCLPRPNKFITTEGQTTMPSIPICFRRTRQTGSGEIKRRKAKTLFLCSCCLFVCFFLLSSWHFTFAKLPHILWWLPPCFLFSLHLQYISNYSPCSNTALSSIWCEWLCSSLNTSPFSNLLLIERALSPMSTSGFLLLARTPIYQRIFEAWDLRLKNERTRNILS